MRILVHHRIASRDGQSVHLEELVEALRREGHTLLLVGPSSFTDIVFGESVNSVDFLKRLIPKPLFECMELAYNLIALQRLYRAVRWFKPDVIYERFSLFLWCGVWASRAFDIPLLLEVNSPLFEERLVTGALSLKLIGRWSQKWLFRRATIILPVTEALAQVVRDYGARREQIFVIPNGVNTEHFQLCVDTEAAKKKIGISSRLVIGFVGFVREWNAVHKLVRFASTYKGRLDVHILIVGDGPARASIETYAQELGISDRVTITGVISRNHVADWLSAIDIAVLPAVTWYSSPLKLFEYMELSRAIIAPDLPNIREILEDGVNAVLFSDKEGELERALERLCDDDDLRVRIGRTAHETIRTRELTWDGNASRIGKIAQTVLEQRVAQQPQSRV